MLRTTLTILLLFGSVAQAQIIQGPIGPGPTNTVSTNPLRIDASLPPYNCKADDGITDCRPMLQKAVDDAGIIAGTKFKKVDVYLPGAFKKYIVYDTVWVDSAQVGLVGDGREATTLAMVGGNRKNVLMFGYRRTDVVNGVNVQIDSLHRPDCFGKLDASACGATGKRWGLATNNDSWGQFQASAVSNGPLSPKYGNVTADHWAETNQLTWEFVIDPQTNLGLNQPLMGVGAFNTNPIFCIGTDNVTQGDLWVRFKTSEMPSTINGSNTREFRFSTNGIPKPWKIAIQFDLANAVITTFVNGNQVPIYGLTNLSPNGTWPFVPGLKGFMANEYYPYMIGADGVIGSFNIGPTTTGLSLNLYGLRFSNTIRYQNNGPGTPQKRVDDSSIPNDLYSYFTDDANTIAYLPLTDNPATLTRNIGIQYGQASGGFVGGGIFMSSSMRSNIPGNSLRNIDIQAWGGPYTIPVCIAAVVDFTLDNVSSGGGFYGIGSWSCFASFTVKASHLKIYGSDAAYYCYSQINQIEDVDVFTSGRTTFRSVASGFRLNSAFIAYPTSYVESAFKAHSGNYGSGSTLKELIVDFEGPIMKGPVIYCENASSSPTTLKIEGLYLGTVGPVPIIQLKDMDRLGSYRPAFIKAVDIEAPAGDHSCLVDVDGPLWYGTIEGIFQGKNPIPLINQRNVFGLNTGIKFITAP